MQHTRLWLIRHAIVSAESRKILYGRMDVGICPQSRALQAGAYRALAARLPRDAAWVVTPLSRTRQTALAIEQAGYRLPALRIEPGLIEQDLGAWQGLTHEELPARLADPAHPFWPLGAGETPPAGESMDAVLDRVGATIEHLAETHRGGDVVCISHGGAIRAAVAHALGVDGRAALHFSVQNLGLTVLDRFSSGWRVVTVNEAWDTLA
jgi:broad specificity phosphatase PhoE